MSVIDPGRRRAFVPLNTQESVDSLYPDNGSFDAKNQGWRENNIEDGDCSPAEQIFKQVKYKLRAIVVIVNFSVDCTT